MVQSKKVALTTDVVHAEAVIVCPNFTLQCCYGHFIYGGQNDPHNLEPLPLTDTIARVEYRLAYIAICIENSDLGRMLFEALKELRTLTQRISSSAVQNGFRKDRSILMRYRLNQTGSSWNPNILPPANMPTTTSVAAIG
jgi:hypothetical protein